MTYPCDNCSAAAIEVEVEVEAFTWNWPMAGYRFQHQLEVLMRGEVVRKGIGQVSPVDAA